MFAKFETVISRSHKTCLSKTKNKTKAKRKKNKQLKNWRLTFPYKPDDLKVTSATKL